ncbi:MAG: tripartite tricarboxylate transporter substrate binding protein [Betaproteobacteria bacterium]|nr:tripartite tricarboxylate transporter substrate binding protein [Betaproteobacteria bacterium]
MLRIACASLLAALFGLPAPSALGAERYPQRPIRLVIPFAPGGGTDVLARALQDKLEAALGASLLIDNRPGGGGTLGVTLVARAAPDGYTLLFTSASYTFAPSLYKDLKYDAIKDFKPITMFAKAPNILVVHPSMPVKSVKQLIALARQRPSEIHYGSAGVGSNIHLTTELFTYMAKIKLVQVPYRGGGPAQIAVITGEVQVLLPGFQSAIPFVRSGQMRALAISTKQRSPALPDLPSIDEAGVPGYDKTGWYALFAPAGVPDSVITHVYQAVAKVLKNPDVLKLLAREGAVVVADPPAEFSKFVREEIAQWAKLIREMKL